MKSVILFFCVLLVGISNAQSDSTMYSDLPLSPPMRSKSKFKKIKQQQDTSKSKTATPLSFVKDMPHYASCEDTANLMAENICTRGLLSKYISQNYVYPEKARENNIQGTVYVQFVIDTLGNVTKVKVVKGVHELLDKAAVEAVSKLPPLIPGRQLGVKVPVIYTVPVKLVLDGIKRKRKKRRRSY